MSSTKMRTNLVVPMVGQGKRFREAGYDTFKPFIPVRGVPMIEHVLGSFPLSVRRHVIANRLLMTPEQERYLKEELDCNIIDVPLHENGPAYSIFEARERLPLDEPFFISYCDISWKWDFDDITACLDHDGVIYTHSGFHPHLVGNNYSAFCLPSIEDPSRLMEIREKGSYTNDWMAEPLSIGLFYLRSGRDMIDGISDMIERHICVENEYFPSLLFNYLVARGRDIRLKRLDYFIHWGIPEQLEDFRRWDSVVSGVSAAGAGHGPDCPENIVVMAGTGKRMKPVSDQPKALIPVGGMPMFEYVMQRFPSRAATLIISPELAEEPAIRNCGAGLFVLERVTGSQYETLLGAVELLCSKSDYFLTSCDAYGLFDYRVFRAFVGRLRPDAVIFGFKPSLLQKKMARHHSYVSVEGEKVTAVHIKAEDSEGKLGLAGFFWVRDGAIFRRFDNIPQETGERYADHIFRYFVEAGMNVAAFELDHYVHLGTPEEFLEYTYWTDRSYLFNDRKKQEGDDPAGARP